MLMAMTRAQLHAHAQRYLKSGGASAPEVALVAYGQARAVFKDYGRVTGGLIRVLAPILLWREADALARLTGLEGVPRLYRRLDARGLLMEYLPGTPWPQAQAPDTAYTRLAALIAAMHARGIAHADLRTPGNMLVGADGTPYIVDFVARVRRGRAWNRPWNWVFAQFVTVDESALAKLRARYARALLTPADREHLARPHRLDPLARWVSAYIRRLVRFLERS